MAKANFMRKIIALFFVLITLSRVDPVEFFGRGGRDTDCPPKSTDPDCK